MITCKVTWTFQTPFLTSSRKKIQVQNGIAYRYVFLEQLRIVILYKPQLNEIFLLAAYWALASALWTEGADVCLERSSYICGLPYHYFFGFFFLSLLNLKTSCWHFIKHNCCGAFYARIFIWKQAYFPYALHHKPALRDPWLLQTFSKRFIKSHWEISLVREM